MKKDEFKEIKIRMVMKLKKLTRCAAIAEIARMDTARQKAFEGENSPENDGKVTKRRRHASDIGRHSDNEGFLTAEDFFSID